MPPSGHARRRTARDRLLMRRRRSLLILMAILLFAATFALLPSTRKSATSTTSTTSTTLVTTTSAVTTTTAPGSLPSTTTRPLTTDAALALRLAPIWTAIVANSPNAGFPVFFPETVYVRMKTGIIANPASDWTYRLWAFYKLDVPAYHRALAGSPARFIAVNANVAAAAWIVPGACENHFGYWHLPNVRIVYEVKGVVRSFAVASLISWRGVWYVVHLGPNPRPVDVGTVALPARGAGTPGPFGGC